MAPKEIASEVPGLIPPVPVTTFFPNQVSSKAGENSNFSNRIDEMNTTDNRCTRSVK
jgi:hypothetical protein